MEFKKQYNVWRYREWQFSGYTWGNSWKSLMNRPTCDQKSSFTLTHIFFYINFPQSILAIYESNIHLCKYANIFTQVSQTNQSLS